MRNLIYIRLRSLQKINQTEWGKDSMRKERHSHLNLSTKGGDDEKKKKKEGKKLKKIV